MLFLNCLDVFKNWDFKLFLILIIWSSTLKT